MKISTKALAGRKVQLQEMAVLHRTCTLSLVFLHKNRQLFSPAQRTSKQTCKQACQLWGVRRCQRGLESEFVVITTAAPQENVFSNVLPWEVCQGMQTKPIMKEQSRFGILRAELVVVHWNRLASCAQTQPQQKRPTSNTIQDSQRKMTAGLIQNHTQLHCEQ